MATLPARAARADKRRTMVFDLDGIALYHVPTDSSGENVITVKETGTTGDVASMVGKFRVADGFPELVEALIARGWRVSVFSFGSKSRNVDALSQIRLPGGGTALEGVRSSGGAVYSVEDATNLDPNDTRKVIDFSLPPDQRPTLVKNLAKVLGADAEEAFLIEDILRNAAPGERATHTIYAPYQWVLAPDGSEVNILEHNDGTFAAAVAAGDKAATKEAIQRFDRLHNKLAYIAGLIDHVESTAKTKGISFQAALAETQWQHQSDGSLVTSGKDALPVLRPNLLDDAAIIHRGAALLESVPQSSYQYALGFNPAKLCGELAARFDRMMYGSGAP